MVAIMVRSSWLFLVLKLYMFHWDTSWQHKDKYPKKKMSFLRLRSPPWCLGNVSWINQDGFHIISSAKMDSRRSNLVFAKYMLSQQQLTRETLLRTFLYFQKKHSKLRPWCHSPFFRPTKPDPASSDKHISKDISYELSDLFLSSLFVTAAMSKKPEPNRCFGFSFFYFNSDSFEPEQVHLTTFLFSSSIFAQITCNIYSKESGAR